MTVRGESPLMRKAGAVVPSRELEEEYRDDNLDTDPDERDRGGGKSLL